MGTNHSNIEPNKLVICPPIETYTEEKKQEMTGSEESDKGNIQRMTGPTSIQGPTSLQDPIRDDSDVTGPTGIQGFTGLRGPLYDESDVTGPTGIQGFTGLRGPLYDESDDENIQVMTGPVEEINPEYIILK